jgi:hypothetical protein
MCNLMHCTQKPLKCSPRVGTIIFNYCSSVFMAGVHNDEDYNCKQKFHTIIFIFKMLNVSSAGPSGRMV